LHFTFYTNAIWAVFVKDIRSELRSRYALNALLLFAVSAAVAVSLGTTSLGLRREGDWLAVQASLLWIALLFAALNGLARSFVQEEETRTALALRLAAPPVAVYLGKLLFNLALLALLDAVTSALFVLFLRVEIGGLGLFAALLAAGSVALAATTTILAAIIAKASLKSALFAVLAFPLLVPLLVVAIRGTTLALEGAGWERGWPFLQTLLAFALAMLTASLLLFRTVWEA
jgi:heme exporter protein B